MIVIELTYKKPLEEVDKYLESHRDFLEKYYNEGVFIVSGAKQPRDGGVILAKATKAEGEKIICEDPFYHYDIATYHIIEFHASKYSDSFKQVLDEVKQ